MTTKKLSEKQIERKLIENANDADSWGTPLTVQPRRSPPPKPAQNAESFLHVARSLNLDGPPDWSSRLDDYLHGDTETTDE